LQLLDFLGLDETAAAVYQVLLTASGCLADICAITGFPESAIRTALGSLAELNLVRAPLGLSDDWRAIRPELAFAALVHQHEADLALRTHQLAALRAAATMAAATWSTRLRDSGGLFERLDNCKDALAEAHRLAAQAVTEYMQVAPVGRGPLPASHSDIAVGEAAVARGVSVKVLYHDSTRSDPAALARARHVARTGAEVRTAPIPPLPVVICDRQIALIPVGRERHEAALCVREPTVVAVLSSVFDNSWDTATPLDSRITSDQTTGLTPSERALLQLLAGGLTDEAAAKRLGVSLRTVRRQMNALMTRLQATSRFQAGHNAAHRGWLNPAPPQKAGHHQQNGVEQTQPVTSALGIHGRNQSENGSTH
jgi:DNA-binding CsgD family transcriptional regulator